MGGIYTGEKKYCLTCFCPRESVSICVALHVICGTHAVVHCFGTGQWHIRGRWANIVGGACRGAVKVKHAFGTRKEDTDGGGGSVVGEVRESFRLEDVLEHLGNPLIIPFITRAIRF